MHFGAGDCNARMMEALYSGRLFIRGLQNEEWHAFWRDFVPDPNAHPDPYTYNAADCEKMFENAVTRAGRYPTFGIFLRETGLPIGVIQLKRITPCQRYAPKKHQPYNQCELGIMLQSSAWQNRGYGTEAMRLLLPWAFTQYHLKRMYAETFATNLRMQHLLPKWGFRFARKIPALYRAPNCSADCLYYVLVRKWYKKKFLHIPSVY